MDNRYPKFFFQIMEILKLSSKQFRIIGGSYALFIFRQNEIRAKANLYPRRHGVLVLITLNILLNL